jgi:hypothetical protein
MVPGSAADLAVAAGSAMFGRWVFLPIPTFLGLGSMAAHGRPDTTPGRRRASSRGQQHIWTIAIALIVYVARDRGKACRATLIARPGYEKPNRASRLLVSPLCVARPGACPTLAEVRAVPIGGPRLGPDAPGRIPPRDIEDSVLLVGRLAR